MTVPRASDTFLYKALAFRSRSACAPIWPRMNANQHPQPRQITARAKNTTPNHTVSDKIALLYFTLDRGFAREFSDNCAGCGCNIEGNFGTHSRCWKSVPKLFRSRIYELFARTTLANLPTGVTKLPALSAPEMELAANAREWAPTEPPALACGNADYRSLTERGSGPRSFASIRGGKMLATTYRTTFYHHGVPKLPAQIAHARSNPFAKTRRLRNSRVQEGG
jgi:hypothetical protein